MVSGSEKETTKLSTDSHFRTSEIAIDFFKKKDRSRPYDLPEVSGARTLSWNCDGTFLACGAQSKVVAAASLDQSCRLVSLWTE